MDNAIRSEWREAVAAALEGQERRPLIEFLQRQRWFGGKGQPLADVRVSDVIQLTEGPQPRLLAIVYVAYREGGSERYVMPLVVRPITEPVDERALVELPALAANEWVCDAVRDPEVWRRLYQSIMEGRELAGWDGCLAGRSMPHVREGGAQAVQAVEILSVEQSNTSAICDRQAMLKLIRKVEAGTNPDSEVLEFLTTQTTYRNVPALLGVLTYDNGMAETNSSLVAVLQQFVPNLGDGWSHTLAHLGALLDEAGQESASLDHNGSKAATGMADGFLKELRQLGEMTGGLHVALASRQEPEAFRPEPVTLCDVEAWETGMLRQLTEVCHDLHSLQSERQSALGLTGDEMTEMEAACRSRFHDLRILSGEAVVKIRHHGDYHLGQVLKTQDRFIAIDFEGEPARPLAERRAKVCPLKDVAGMLRSFSYAGQVALKRRAVQSVQATAMTAAWESSARGAFLDGYRAVARPGQAAFLPASWEAAVQVIRVYELDKALYELRYELRNRPDWLSIPLQGIRELLRQGERK